MSLKGQPTLQIINGWDRDNTIILVAVSGSGEALPPFLKENKSKQDGAPQ